MGKQRKSPKNIIEILPAVAVSVTVFVSYCILSINGSHERGNVGIGLSTAGFLAMQPGQAFRRLEKRREGRGSQSELRVRLPHPSKVEADEGGADPLFADVSLTSIQNLWQSPHGNGQGSGWEFLTMDVRRHLDQPKLGRNRWDDIVLHHSNSSGGNASMLRMYHDRVRGLKGGLAYHFVIGNGAYSNDGEIEVGERWRKQSPAGSAPGEAPSPRSISICLVGDFSSHQPTCAQLRSLDELVRYLHAKIGVVSIRSHHRTGDGFANCPGRYFPRDTVMARLNKGK